MQHLTTLLAVALFAGTLAAQQPLYNRQQDERAKAAAALVPDLKTGLVFDRQIRNAELVAQQEIDAYFQESRRRARSTIDAFQHWSDIERLIEKTKASISGGPSVTADAAKIQRDALDAQKKAAEKAAADLRAKVAAAPPDVLAAILAQSDKLKPAADFAQSLLGENILTPAHMQTIAEVGSVLDEIRKAHEALAQAFDEVAAKQQELAGLTAPLQQIAIDLLDVEVDFWSNVAAIRERREADAAEVRTLVAECEGLLTRLRANSAAGPAEAIADTIRNSMNSALGEDVMLTLYFAAALAARGQAPAELALLRLGREHHLHEIRRSAVRARAVELTVTAGVQRLALLYQGGIKPMQVAQLFHALAAIATPPLIAFE